MDEHVRPIRIADQETIALQPVEPFHHRAFERAGRIDQAERIDAIGIARRPGRILDRVGQVDADHFARLIAAAALHRQRLHPRPFGQAAPAVRLQHRKMDQHVAIGRIVRHREAEAARRVEPFDDAADRDGAIVCDGGAGRRVRRGGVDRIPGFHLSAERAFAVAGHLPVVSLVALPLRLATHHCTPVADTLARFAAQGKKKA
ncbi:hypothetical protein WR25_13071 [Diploscapter pachys]|uniref:Uncharacterized protein n=1 Tax=Diploscapter pachys TaxID=2018661 RepID=A0A2A2M3L7_9BILA|nr:hypothetical protein WR25_13071 [Diploscapter pachys]